jgi:hypothetical protein
VNLIEDEQASTTTYPFGTGASEATESFAKTLLTETDDLSINYVGQYILQASECCLYY